MPNGTRVKNRKFQIDMTEEEAREALMEAADSLGLARTYVNKEQLADALVERLRLWQGVIEARKGKR